MKCKVIFWEKKKKKKFKMSTDKIFIRHAEHYLASMIIHFLDIKIMTSLIFQGNVF